MAGKKTKMAIGGVMYAVLFALGSETITGSLNTKTCGGTEWWNEKILSPGSTTGINFTPVVTTIKDLTSKNTDNVDFSTTRPRPPIENQAYTVNNVLITLVKRESDNDYHIVIEDGKNNHMIVEIPDPDCPDAQASSHCSNYQKARDEMDKYGTSYRHHLFDVTGVLFVDKAHGQTGHADNNVELHPVLSLKAVK